MANYCSSPINPKKFPDNSGNNLIITNKTGILDQDKHTILDKIEIDLPSMEDMQSLRNAREKEIINTTLSEENYNFNQTTDLAALTGRQRYSDKYYLSDPVEEYEYGIVYYDDYDGGIKIEDDDTNRYSRKFLIRPVLRFNKCPELFDSLLSSQGINKDGKQKYAKIQLGWMPKCAVAKSHQAKLDKELKNKNVIKTSAVYTFDSTYVHSDKNNKKEFKPVEYPVYEYNGKKYIHFKVTQNYGGKDLIDKVTFSKSDAIMLSNNQTYFNGNMVWIMVLEISWVVDVERKTLISQKGLLSGIQFEKTSKGDDKPVNYPTSNIKWYLDTYMKYEMLSNDELLFKKAKEIRSSSAKNNSSKITEILKKIGTYKKYYYGNIDIESKVNELINKYNQDLDNLSKNIDHESTELSIGIKNPCFLYQRLIIDLEDLLSELIINGEKVKNYHDMIDILNECKKDEIDSNKDELCGIINTIKTVILDFIANEKVKNKLKEELNNIIINNINKNISYINEFKLDNNHNTKSLDELKLEFKRDLQPYLEKLSLIVEKQDLVNEIMNNVKTMVNNHFTESKNKIIKNFLVILNDIISNIKENGTNEDNNELMKVVESDFDINDEIDEIIRKLESMIIKAYKIELNIQERKAKYSEINNLRVNIDISSIFNDNSKAY